MLQAPPDTDASECFLLPLVICFPIFVGIFIPFRALARLPVKGAVSTIYRASRLAPPPPLPCPQLDDLLAAANTHTHTYTMHEQDVSVRALHVG